MSGPTEGTVTQGESLTVKRFIAAAPEAVFDAWTDAEGMSKWMRPGDDLDDSRVTLDVRVGGEYTIDMVKGDTVLKHRGEYREVDRPRRLVFTWNADWIPGGSLVTVEFHARDGGTEVVLRHEGLPSAESAANHTAGWGAILERLERRLG